MGVFPLDLLDDNNFNLNVQTTKTVCNYIFLKSLYTHYSCILMHINKVNWPKIDFLSNLLFGNFISFDCIDYKKSKILLIK